MKRRLMNTYDRIVMPEDCARRIEGKIQQAIRTKASGTYSRNVAPSVPHPCRWAVAAVMVFLVICLGASLILRLADRMENTPMTSRNTTPEDHYSMATSVPPEEVEAFAEEIRKNVQISTKDQEEANIWYDGVLRDNRQIEFPEWNTQYTISQYCQRRSAETGKEVTCPQFTLVDMDDDGVKELILRIRPEGEPLDDYLIVRYQKSGVYDGIYCYAELRQMISGLKKDGAFFWERENARWVASLEALGNGVEKGLSVPEAAQRCPVRWHSTSVVDPFFVLDSYVIIGEEVRGEVLGGQFFYFEQMLAGKLDGDWKKLQEHLQLNGFRCEAENGSMAIYDPASPGCVLFGTMNENNCLDSIGYYICDETGEKMAEVRNICSGVPEYRVDVNLVWEQETLGRPVSSPEEVLQYFRS